MLNVKRIEQLYHENNQYLPFESHYEDDGKLTEQMCCIVDPKKNKCLICVRIQTLKNLYDYKWGYTPQFYFDKEYNSLIYNNGYKYLKNRLRVNLPDSQLYETLSWWRYSDNEQYYNQFYNVTALR